MIKYLFLTLLGISSTFYAQDTLKFTDLYGDYLGQTPPGDTPVAFAPGIVSGKYQEHGFPAFSSEDNEVFWQTNRKSESDINKWIISGKTMKRIENRWTEPEDISFISSVFSPDVKKLFTSILNDKFKGTIKIVSPKLDNCFCLFVDKTKMPKKFCNCTKGWQKETYEFITGKQVNVKIDASF